MYLTATRAEVNAYNKDEAKTKKIREIKSQVSLAPLQKTIDTFLKFAFQIDSVTVNLFTGKYNFDQFKFVFIS
jgi:hypothetical protein